jgi:hypothetical protein
MDLEAKIELVNETKKIIDMLIKDGADKFLKYDQRIDEEVKKHNDFIDYVDKLKIYKKYEWDNLKNDYKDLKKSINKDKYIIQQTTKNFDIVLNYYSIEEGYNVNKKLNEIYEKSNLMLYNFKNLKKIHREVLNKLKIIAKSDDFIKIEIYNNKLIPIFTKFNEIYMDMKLIHKKLGDLRSRKGNLLYEMNQLKEKK